MAYDVKKINGDILVLFGGYLLVFYSAAVIHQIMSPTFPKVKHKPAPASFEANRGFAMFDEGK